MQRFPVLMAGLVMLCSMPLRASASPATQPVEERPPFPIGIVDLDKVAMDLGLMSKLQANLKEYDELLKQDIKDADANYQQQVNAFIESLVPAGRVPAGTKEGDKIELHLTPAQQQQLSAAIANVRQAETQLQQLGNTALQTYRDRWVVEFRKAVSPVVRQVAQERKIRLALLEGPATVLYADDAINLTDAVVDAARTKMPALHDPLMDHLKWQVNILPAGQRPASDADSPPTGLFGGASLFKSQSRDQK